MASEQESKHSGLFRLRLGGHKDSNGGGADMYNDSAEGNQERYGQEIQSPKTPTTPTTPSKKGIVSKLKEKVKKVKDKLKGRKKEVGAVSSPSSSDDEGGKQKLAGTAPQPQAQSVQPGFGESRDQPAVQQGRGDQLPGAAAGAGEGALGGAASTFGQEQAEPAEKTAAEGPGGAFSSGGVAARKGAGSGAFGDYNPDTSLDQTTSALPIADSGIGYHALSLVGQQLDLQGNQAHLSQEGYGNIAPGLHKASPEELGLTLPAEADLSAADVSLPAGKVDLAPQQSSLSQEGYANFGPEGEGQSQARALAGSATGPEESLKEPSDTLTESVQPSTEATTGAESDYVPSTQRVKDGMGRLGEDALATGAAAAAALGLKRYQKDEGQAQDADLAAAGTGPVNEENLREPIDGLAEKVQPASGATAGPASDYVPSTQRVKDGMGRLGEGALAAGGAAAAALGLQREQKDQGHSAQPAVDQREAGLDEQSELDLQGNQANLSQEAHYDRPQGTALAGAGDLGVAQGRRDLPAQGTGIPAGELDSAPTRASIPQEGDTDFTGKDAGQVPPPSDEAGADNSYPPATQAGKEGLTWVGEGALAAGAAAGATLGLGGVLKQDREKAEGGEKPGLFIRGMQSMGLLAGMRDSPESAEHQADRSLPLSQNQAAGRPSGVGMTSSLSAAQDESSGPLAATRGVGEDLRGPAVESAPREAPALTGGVNAAHLKEPLDRLADKVQPSLENAAETKEVEGPYIDPTLVVAQGIGLARDGILAAGGAVAAVADRLSQTILYEKTLGRYATDEETAYEAGRHHVHALHGTVIGTGQAVRETATGATSAAMQYVAKPRDNPDGRPTLYDRTVGQLPDSDTAYATGAHHAQKVRETALAGTTAATGAVAAAVNYVAGSNKPDGQPSFVQRTLGPVAEADPDTAYDAGKRHARAVQGLLQGTGQAVKDSLAVGTGALASTVGSVVGTTPKENSEGGPSIYDSTIGQLPDSDTAYETGKQHARVVVGAVQSTSQAARETAAQGAASVGDAMSSALEQGKSFVSAAATTVAGPSGMTDDDEDYRRGKAHAHAVQGALAMVGGAVSSAAASVAGPSGMTDDDEDYRRGKEHAHAAKETVANVTHAVSGAVGSLLGRGSQGTEHANGAYGVGEFGAGSSAA